MFNIGRFSLPFLTFQSCHVVAKLTKAPNWRSELRAGSTEWDRVLNVEKERDSQSFLPDTDLCSEGDDKRSYLSDRPRFYNDAPVPIVEHLSEYEASEIDEDDAGWTDDIDWEDFDGEPIPEDQNAQLAGITWNPIWWGLDILGNVFTIFYSSKGDGTSEYLDTIPDGTTKSQQIHNNPRIAFKTQDKDSGLINLVCFQFSRENMHTVLSYLNLYAYFNGGSASSINMITDGSTSPSGGIQFVLPDAGLQASDDEQARQKKNNDTRKFVDPSEMSALARRIGSAEDLDMFSDSFGIASADLRPQRQIGMFEDELDDGVETHYEKPLDASAKFGDF